jgi:hypothetical protein
MIERYICRPTPRAKGLQTYLTTCLFSSAKEKLEYSVRDRRSLLEKVLTELYRYDGLDSQERRAAGEKGILIEEYD